MIKLHEALNEGPEPHMFTLATSGVAANGLPIYNWTEAANQLTRDSTGWVFTPDPVTVTYAFRLSEPIAGMPDTAGGFSRFNTAQIAAAETALQLWSDVANITFTRAMGLTPGLTEYSNSATILFANYSSGVAGAAAFAYLPHPANTAANQEEGDIWVNVTSGDNGNPTFGEYGQHVLTHEIGHAIGLSHPSDYDGGDPTYPADATYWQDARMFTVMSYFGSSGTGGSLNAFAAGPQLHDIAGAQKLYGANMTARADDTIYGFNSNTGLQHYTISGGTGGPVFAIWDAGGNDTIDFSGYSTATEIDLREEAFSSAGPGNGGGGVAVGNISIARGAVIENAIGGSGADIIHGNAVANTLHGNGGADTINGDGGADYVDGGAGADSLNGGEGDDTILWDAGDSLANILGGNGLDLLVFTSGVTPTSFVLGAHGFEHAEGRFTDTGANVWATRTEVYDALWRADVTIVVYDDGSRETTDYDEANSVNWVAFFTRQDALLRTAETVLFYDDGVRDVTIFDRDDSFFWDSFVTRQDALARTTESLLIHDDGVRDTTNFDPEDFQFWDSFVTRRDALGRTTESLLIHDDGVRDTTNFDPGDSFFWDSFVTRRDALGRTTESLLIHDDGVRDATNIDADDSFFWESFVTRRDALGHTADTLLIYDDGRRDSTDYDEANAYDWANVVFRYDPNLVLQQTITTYDDGSVVII